MFNSTNSNKPGFKREPITHDFGLNSIVLATINKSNLPTKCLRKEQGL